MGPLPHWFIWGARLISLDNGSLLGCSRIRFFDCRGFGRGGLFAVWLRICFM